MKKFIIFTLACFLCFPLISQDYWQHVHTNDTNTIWSMEIANDGTIYYGGTGGLYISYDDGYTWECKTILPYLAIYTIEFDLDSNLLVGAINHLYKYKIDKDEWELLLEGEHTYAFTAIHVDTSQILAGTIAALYRYKDGLWEELESHPAHVGLQDIVKDSLGRLYTCSTNFGGGGGVTESLDNGDSWTLIGLENSYLRDLEVDSQNRLYAGSSGHHEYGIGGLYRYNLEDKSWDTLRINHRIQSILINAEDSLYVGQYSTGGPPAGAFMSTDLGETWYDISSGFLGGGIPNVMELNIGPDNFLYAIVQDVNSIYKSSSPVIVHTKENSRLLDEDIIVYPNPFTAAIHIRIKNPTFQNGFLSLYNLKGETILDRTGFTSISNELRLTELDGLPQGVYFLKLETNKKIRTIKLIK